MEEVKQGVIQYTLPTTEEVHAAAAGRLAVSARLGPDRPELLRQFPRNPLVKEAARTDPVWPHRLPMIELGALLLFGVVIVAVIVAFAAVMKAIFWIVLLPVRLVFWRSGRS